MLLCLAADYYSNRDKILLTENELHKKGAKHGRGSIN
jgi:hypothetical protein